MATKTDRTKALAKSEKRILITGGTGFLGTQIVRNFLEKGEKNLRVMASRVPVWMKDAGIEAAEGSVTNKKDVAEAVKNVSAIYHLAGKVSRDNNDAFEMNKIHLEGTRLLCEAARENGVQTFILASSSGTIAVSDSEEILDETANPPLDIISRWAYYASKFYQERTALENFNEKGTKIVILNPSLLLGAGDERLSSTKIVLDFIGKKIPLTPSGGLNFVDVRDAAEAFINALERARNREKYLLGAENMTFANFFGRLERLSGISAPRLKLPKNVSVAGANLVDSFFTNWNWKSPIQPKEVEQAEYFWYLDASKAKEELDFAPRDANETLQDTISYIRKNFLGDSVFK